MDGRIYHLRTQILDNPLRDWTVDEMASAVGLSAPHLHRLFKLHAGIPPISFVRGLRMELARELMETSFLQIKQIGLHVGIANESQFTREFKRRFGVSPTEYRRGYWEKNQAAISSVNE